MTFTIVPFKMVYTSLERRRARTALLRDLDRDKFQLLAAKVSIVDLAMIANRYKHSHYDEATRAFLELGDRDDSLDFLADVEIKSSDVKALLELNSQPYFEYYDGRSFYDDEMSYLYHFGLVALPSGAGPHSDYHDKHKPQATGLNTRGLVVKELLKEDTTTAGKIAEAINVIADNQGGYYKLKVSHPTKETFAGTAKTETDMKPQYMLYGHEQLLALIVKSVCAQGNSSEKQALLAFAPTLCMTNQERLLNYVNSLMLVNDFDQAEGGAVTAEMLGVEHADKSERARFFERFKESSKDDDCAIIDLDFASENAVNFYRSYEDCPDVAGKKQDFTIKDSIIFSVSEKEQMLRKRNITPPPFPSENYGCVDGEDRAAFYQCLHEKMVESLVV